MSAAVFLPDPLLARTAPAPDRGGFGVEALLSPTPLRFEPDPVLSPSAVPSQERAEVAFLEAPGHDPLPEPEVQSQALPDPDRGAGLHELAADIDVQALLDQRYREGFEDGMAEAARLGLPGGEVPPSMIEGAIGSPIALGMGDGGSMGHGPEFASPPTGATSTPGARDVVLLLESLSRALQPLLLPDDAATRFEPLKRLALHLAMELVRRELSVSPKVVEELVRRSVQALQAGEQAPLTVELHPQDLALLRQALNDPESGLDPHDPLLQRVSWREDPQLGRGSVRARSDVSTVEDLIEHRLASIMQDLRIQSPRWQLDETRMQQELEPEPPTVPGEGNIDA